MKPSEPDIDEMLERLRDSSTPHAPANVEQHVLRRVRLAAANQGGWRPEFWPRWLTNPAFGLGLAFVSGAMGILFATMVSAGGKDPDGSAAEVDPLAVFSSRAPGMLSPRNQ